MYLIYAITLGFSLLQYSRMSSIPSTNTACNDVLSWVTISEFVYLVSTDGLNAIVLYPAIANLLYPFLN